jgi:ribosome-associated translation inhibitor RaiA
MKYSDQSYNLRIELDTKNCELTASDIAELEDALSPLRHPVESFPVTDLYITIEHKPRSQDYQVKAALQLPGRGLVTGDQDEAMFPAFRRCVRKLVHKVSAYKERLEHAEDAAKHAKGTRHDVVAAQPIDAQQLTEAIEAGDYGAFRKLTYPFEESLRKRIGRWIQRYPDVDARLGLRFDLADIVEEVFLNAFERFQDRPRKVPFGDWLEGLVDPSVRLLNEHTDEELSAISFARSAMEAEVQEMEGEQK